MARQQLSVAAVLLLATAASAAAYVAGLTFVASAPSPLGASRAAAGAAPAALPAAPPAAAHAAPHGLGAAAAVAALLAAAAFGNPRRRVAARAPAVLVELPAAALVTAAPAATEQRSLVAMKSMNSCFTLYFKSGWIYRDRARRNIRNRAYNIFMKNKYKKAMKLVLRYTVDLEFGDLQPESKDEVMSEIKERLDTACLSIDETCVQGIIHRNKAAHKKDRLCRAILRGCIKKGLMEKPEDPFEPAFITLGYKLPRYGLTREPRPWQLPGWKSPWMLKREFNKWQKQREKA